MATTRVIANEKQARQDQMHKTGGHGGRGGLSGRGSGQTL